MRRGTTAATCRRCLAVAGWPTLALALTGWIVVQAWPAATGPDVAPGAASPWLVLPLVGAALVCATTGVAWWPTFARSRPGSDWVQRLAAGRLAGVPAAIAGILLAQLLLTLPLTCGLAHLLGAPPRAYTHHAPSPPAAPLLGPDRPALVFTLPAHEAWQGVRLRPLASMPTAALVGAELAVLGDGDLLGLLPTPIVQTNQLVGLDFPARTLRELRLEYRAGTVPLAFPPGTLVVVGATPHSATWNGALLALLGLVPTFVACAGAALAGRGAGLPTVLAVLASLGFVLTIGGVGAFDRAVLAHLRGQWLGSTDCGSESLAWTAAGVGALLVLAVARRGELLHTRALPWPRGPSP